MIKRITYLIFIEIITALIGIALLTVGVLQGVEMLNQMRTKKIVAQLNEYNEAANSFRSKYGKLPGDFNYAHSRGIDRLCDECEINTYPTLTTFIKGINDGDGDGRLNSAGNGFFNFSGEMRNFWIHMSNTGYVEEQFSQNDNNNSLFDILAPSAEASMISKIGTVGMSFPRAAMGNGIIALTDKKDLNYMIGVSSRIGPTIGPEGSSGVGDTLTTQQSYLLDSKIDDGMPSSGFIRVVGNYNGYSGKFDDDTTLGDDDCYSASGGGYNLNVLLKVCTLRVKATLLTGQVIE